MDAFALPMDADPSRDQVVGYDEFGRPVRAGRLGTRYIQGAAPMRRNSLAGTPLSLADVMATSGGARGAGQPRQTSQLAPANAPEASWGPLGGLANMLLEGFQAPGNALAGRPVTLGEVWGTAGTAAMGAAPMRAPENSLRMFAGRNAKTADLDAAARAEQLLQAGVSRDDVWRETGWMRGVDGQMRFEIDDSAMALKRGSGELGLKRRSGMSDSVVHDELYAAYPDAAGIAYKPNYSGGGQTLGSYSRADDRIEISAATLRSRPETKSTTAHEIQHALQAREGFARGGSTAVAYQLKERADQMIFEANKRLKYLANEMDKARSARDVARLDRLKTEYDGVMDYKLGKVDVAMADPYEMYRSFSGEVEARNVQTRLNMTPAERRASPPWATQDVPDDKQLVRGRDPKGN